MTHSVLIIDDEISIIDVLTVLLEDHGYTVFSATTGKQALALVEREGSFDLVISDIRLPDIDGIVLLGQLKKINPSMDVIMLTAFSSMSSMVEAMKLGATDYLLKPFNTDQLGIVIGRVIEQRKLREENVFLKNRLKTEYVDRLMIGKSKKINEILQMIQKIADLPSTVLVTGESGTGKELVASGIHYGGFRRDKPFVTVNCGALPESLLESELFGHRKGAFTGAIDNKQGLLEFAHGGSFFLDEVGDMSPAIQVKLLRFLTDRKFKRVGGVTDISVDVRIIAATNKNPEELVAQGKFRADLYYRLNVIPIHIPPLRERPEDIPLLVEHFLAKYSRTCSSAPKSVSQAAMRVLYDYEWPGNVRELENVLERVTALESSQVIEPEHLPPYLRVRQPSVEIGAELSIEALQRDKMDLDNYLLKLERQMLIRALEQSQGVKKRAAQKLNISFRSLRYRLEKHELDKSDGFEQDNNEDD